MLKIIAANLWTSYLFRCNSCDDDGECSKNAKNVTTKRHTLYSWPE